jgi:predicted HAD superfamily phosphohydrolase YqeG
MHLLIPRKTYNSIFDIPLKKLYALGTKGIIIDLDNTLTEWNNPELSGDTITWIERAKEIGFKLCFVSNNSDLRVREVADDLISIGTIGLIKAINTFNTDRGTKLATYAARCIENEILMTRSPGKMWQSGVPRL